MSATIQCDIVSAHKEIFSGEVSMFIATGTAGDLGITPRHAPLMTTLQPGPLRLISPGGEETVFFVDSGILEVMPHLITVLADTAERAEHLDRAAALKAKEDAERELLTSTSELKMNEAEAQLAIAMAQLETLERHSKKVKKI